MMIALMALAALAGCSSAANGPPGEVKLGVDVAPIIAAGTDTTNTTAGTGIELSRVRVLMAVAKIGYHQDQATGPAAEIGPIVVDLTADEIKNGAHRDFSLGTLPGGTYGGAEIEINPLAAGTTSDDAALADFLAQGASLLVDGTYNGAAFTFAGHFAAEQGTDGDVTVDAATPVSLALTVDPSTWFLDASGAFIDPTNSANQSTLAVAICKTLDTEDDTSTTSANPGASTQGHGDKGGGGSGGPMAHCVE
jgi:hypothetical protein